jgi:hypothetical protein
MMLVLLWVVIAVAVISTSGFYISWRATRLDRLHARIETARAALDAALLRRCAVVLEMATSGLLDPASVVILADAEKDARRFSDSGALLPERAQAEQNLSQAVTVLYEQADLKDLLTRDEHTADYGLKLLNDLDEATARLSIAEQFYNETVNLTVSSRQRPLSRFLHLPGNAPEPTHFTPWPNAEQVTLG